MNEPTTGTPVPAKSTPTTMRSPEQGRPAPSITMGPRAARAVAPGMMERSPAPQQVDLQIEELVLHGFPRGDRQRIGDAIQVELRRLVGERIASGGFSSDIEIPRIEGGAFTVRRGMRPEQVGIEIARAIMKGMG